jgi:hypothetical protein
LRRPPAGGGAPMAGEPFGEVAAGGAPVLGGDQIVQLEHGHLGIEARPR